MKDLDSTTQVHSQSGPLNQPGKGCAGEPSGRRWMVGRSVYAFTVFFKALWTAWAMENARMDLERPVIGYFNN